jgi:hypothetical protein
LKTKTVDVISFFGCGALFENQKPILLKIDLGFNLNQKRKRSKPFSGQDQILLIKQA